MSSSPVVAEPSGVEITSTDGAEVARERRRWLRALLADPFGRTGLVILMALVVFSFIGPIVYRTNQHDAAPSLVTLAPSVHHLLGTDSNGFDVLGRLMLAGQTSLLIGMGAALLATLIGVAWGTAAGYAGGAIDGLLMRIGDAMLAIPALFVLMFIAAIRTPTPLLLVVAIAAVTCPGIARLVRGQTLVPRKAEYVQAARAMGAGPIRIVVRHIVPNVSGVILVAMTLAVADSILWIAALSFLGLGLPQPQTDWGSMLSDGVNYTYAGYWWLIFPAGLGIVLAIVAFNLVGEALREILDLRLRDR